MQVRLLPGALIPNVVEPRQREEGVDAIDDADLVDEGLEEREFREDAQHLHQSTR